MRYVLQIHGWIDWEEERTFDSLEIAIVYGKERFSHNIWRVIDRFSQMSVHQYDPSIAFEQSAINDIERFARTDRWVAQRDASLRVSQRQRMGQIASRQRAERNWSVRNVLESAIDEFVSRRNKKENAKYEKVDWRNEGF